MRLWPNRSGKARRDHSPGLLLQTVRRLWGEVQCLILLVTSRAALTSADGSQSLVLSSGGLLLGSFLPERARIELLGCEARLANWCQLTVAS